MVGRPIGTRKTGSIQTEINGQVLDAHIMDDLVIAALHKRTINVAVRNQSLCGQAGGKSYGMLFRNAHIKARSGISFIMMFMDEPEGMAGVMPIILSFILANSTNVWPKTSWYLGA